MDGFRTAVDSYDPDKNVGIVDSVQSVFKCCGVTSSADYLTKGKGIPSSCEIATYATGCETAVPDTLGDYIVVIAGVSIGAGAIMVRS